LWEEFFLVVGEGGLLLNADYGLLIHEFSRSHTMTNYTR